MKPAGMADQLALPVQLRDGASFANYFRGPNAEAAAAVEAAAAGRGERFVFLWGGAGSGKTHLLHAACRAAQAQGAAYVPLGEGKTLSPLLLDGLERTALVCLDDIDAVAGLADWEQGLFHLYNRLRDGAGRLIVAADRPPAQLALALPDLQSRLGWGLVLQLHGLGEEDQLQALQQRARERGLELPRDVGQYLLRRWPRDNASLFALLERLDRASLAAQRRLTIPFVRALLDESAR